MIELNELRAYPGTGARIVALRSRTAAGQAVLARPGEVRIVVTDQLDDLRAHWPRLADPGETLCHPFQCAEFLDVWLRTIGKVRGTTPCFVAVIDAWDRALMLLPFGIERRAGVRTLCFLDGDVSDYNVPIVPSRSDEWSAETFVPLWERILAALPAFDVALLEKMPARIGERANPLMLLDPVQEGACGHLRSRDKLSDLHDLRLWHPKSRRKLRKLSEIGPVQWIVARSDQERSALLDSMFAFKQRRFEETRVPGFEVPGKRAFYEEANRRLAPSGRVHLSALQVGETVIASHWGLLFGDRLYHLMPGHAGGKWSVYSPGKLLNEHIVAWCDEAGLRVDFGIGDEPYKAEYCNLTIPLYGKAIARTALGRTYLRCRSALARLRSTRAWQGVRPLKWLIRRAFQGRRNTSPPSRFEIADV